MKNTQQGFALIPIIIAIAVVAVISFLGWRFYEYHNQPKPASTATIPSTVQNPSAATNPTPDNSNITNNIQNFDLASPSFQEALLNNFYAQAKTNCEAENASLEESARINWYISVRKTVRDQFALAHFCGSGGTSVFVKVDGQWKIVASLAMAPGCAVVDQYQISKEVVDYCTPASGGPAIPVTYP